MSTVSILSTGTVDITSSTTLTLTGTNGIFFGSSYVYGLEKKSGTVGSSTPGYVTIDAMAGTITSASTTLASLARETIHLTNNGISETSLVMVHTGDSTHCAPSVTRVKARPDGRAVITINNMDDSACTSAYTLNYLVVN